ncbi:MAG: helix-turn-helix transcriptional regulator, partial [Muribaculaceae bacterium]|nr:helix-turn-helix transcriptional regulator [Muribaculaceae bacterium]
LTGVRHPIDIGDTKILTRRELQILSIIREGHTSKEVSELLHISRNTVSRHRQEIISKLGTRNIIEAIKVCETIGLL